MLSLLTATLPIARVGTWFYKSGGLFIFWDENTLFRKRAFSPRYLTSHWWFVNLQEVSCNATTRKLLSEGTRGGMPVKQGLGELEMFGDHGSNLDLRVCVFEFGVVCFWSWWKSFRKQPQLENMLWNKKSVDFVLTMFGVRRGANLQSNEC